jgi:mannitol/fructose-specific phosphotransferase system IIA component (Ntr-type)
MSGTAIYGGDTMYETKALLICLAEHAVATDSKQMYRIIANMANAEGVVLKSFEEAKAEREEQG